MVLACVLQLLRADGMVVKSLGFGVSLLGFELSSPSHLLCDLGKPHNLSMSVFCFFSPVKFTCKVILGIE